MTARDVQALVGNLSLSKTSKHLASEKLEKLLAAQGFVLDRRDVGKGSGPGTGPWATSIAILMYLNGSGRSWAEMAEISAPNGGA